jgi:hypothetical protein
MGDKKGHTYKVLLRKFEGKRPVAKPRRKLENNIKIASRSRMGA